MRYNVDVTTVFTLNLNFLFRDMSISMEIKEHGRCCFPSFLHCIWNLEVTVTAGKIKLRKVSHDVTPRGLKSRGWIRLITAPGVSCNVAELGANSIKMKKYAFKAVS